MLSKLLPLIAIATAQIQFTPDQSNWAAMDTLVFAVKNVTDHSPNGTQWVSSWPTWDYKKPVNVTKMTGLQIQRTLCTGGIVRGIRQVYDQKPFKNPRYPTKAEVDDYNLRTIFHLRRMIGIPKKLAIVNSTRCTASKALWSQELLSTNYWDSKYPVEKANSVYVSPHCNFVPSVASDQTFTFGGVRDYTVCTKGTPAEGVATTNADIPWSLKYSRIICQFIKDAHGGPLFGRQYVHANFFYPGYGKDVVVRVKGEGKLFKDARYMPKY